MIGFFENLLFIGKFQKMIGLMILVKSGVHKILFSLRLTVITVCHHQIPVNFFLHDILRYVEGIFAFAHILDNGSSGTAFLQNLTERGLLKLLALLHGSFREYPSFIFIFIIFIYFLYKYYHVTAPNSSFLRQSVTTGSFLVTNCTKIISLHS